MPRFASAEIFLEKNSFRVINVLQPGAGVLQGLTQNGVDGAARRAQGILDHESAWMPFEHLFRFQTIARHVGLRKGYFEIVTELAREVPLPLNSHPFSDRTKDWDIRQLVFPRRLRPIDRHRHD